MRQPPSFAELKIKCQNCSLKSLCLPVELNAEEMSKLNALVSSQIHITKNEQLFAEGDAFTGFYIVRSGAFKYVEALKSHQPSVLAFYLPGDFFGLDAIHLNQYPATVIAIEDSSVCKVDFDILLSLSHEIPSLQRFILNIMSEKSCQTLSRTSQHYTAEQKCIAFILKLSDHMTRRGFSPDTFTLPMARKDIANHLDLASETISRVFSDLQKQGLVSLDHKQVKILNLTELNVRLER